MKKLLLGILILLLLAACNTDAVPVMSESDALPDTAAEIESMPLPSNLSDSGPFTLDDLTSWLFPVGNSIWSMQDALDITADEIELALATNGNIVSAADNRITLDLGMDGTLLHFHADVEDVSEIVPHLPGGIAFGDSMTEALFSFQLHHEDAILFSEAVRAGEVDDFNNIYIPVYGDPDLGSYGYIVAGYDPEGALMLILEYSLELDGMVYVITYFFDVNGSVIGFCSSLFDADDL